MFGRRTWRARGSSLGVLAVAVLAGACASVSPPADTGSTVAGPAPAPIDEAATTVPPGRSLVLGPRPVRSPGLLEDGVAGRGRADRPGRPSAGCDAPGLLEAGVHARPWRDVDRQVIVRLPGDFEDSSAPRPVVFNLHGSGASATSHDAFFHLSRPATERGYVVLVPEGMPPTEESPLQVWEFFPGIGPDDPGYLASLVDWIGEVACVDLDRVFATGFSNGGTMTNALACHTEGRFRAVAAVAAHRFPVTCPSGPVSVLGIHGTDDMIVPYLGGPLLRRPDIWMPPVEETFASWAEVAGCEIAPRYQFLPGGAVHHRWSGCAPGTDVQLYAVVGGGHAWPRIDDPVAPAPIDATIVILDFFDAH